MLGLANKEDYHSINDTYKNVRDSSDVNMFEPIEVRLFAHKFLKLKCKTKKQDMKSNKDWLSIKLLKYTPI